MKRIWEVVEASAPQSPSLDALRASWDCIWRRRGFDFSAMWTQLSMSSVSDTLMPSSTCLCRFSTCVAELGCSIWSMYLWMAPRSRSIQHPTNFTLLARPLEPSLAPLSPPKTPSRRLLGDLLHSSSRNPLDAHGASKLGGWTALAQHLHMARFELCSRAYAVHAPRQPCRLRGRARAWRSKSPVRSRCRSPLPG